MKKTWLICLACRHLAPLGHNVRQFWIPVEKPEYSTPCQRCGEEVSTKEFKPPAQWPDPDPLPTFTDEELALFEQEFERERRVHGHFLIPPSWSHQHDTIH